MGITSEKISFYIYISVIYFSPRCTRRNWTSLRRWINGNVRLEPVTFSSDRFFRELVEERSPRQRSTWKFYALPEEQWLTVGHGVNGSVPRSRCSAWTVCRGPRLHLSRTRSRKGRRVVRISRFTKKLAINLRPVYGPMVKGMLFSPNK